MNAQTSLSRHTKVIVPAYGVESLTHVEVLLCFLEKPSVRKLQLPLDELQKDGERIQNGQS